ncbi:MAG: hypothetical protein KBT45_09120 [Bacteroidales bacterium]|nr:hypothetical protein [Candidatus Colimorpha pelethequi]
MKRFILSLLVVANVIALTSCHKGSNDLILGSWANTEESCNPGGTIPAGTICLKFRADDSVEVADIRMNIIGVNDNIIFPGTKHYSTMGDTLVIDSYGRFQINSLERNNMILTHINPNGWSEEILFFEREK